MTGRLNGKTNFIFSRDPALDRSDETHLAAELTKANESGTVNGLPLKEGRRPVVWHLMSLTERAYSELTRTSLFEVQKLLPQGVNALFDQAAYPTRRDAVRRGLVGSEGAVDENGRPMALDVEETSGGKVLTAKAIEQLYRCYGPRLIGELGQRIIEVSETDPT